MSWAEIAGVVYLVGSCAVFGILLGLDKAMEEAGERPVGWARLMVACTMWPYLIVAAPAYFISLAVYRRDPEIIAKRLKRAAAQDEKGQ